MRYKARPITEPDCPQRSTPGFAERSRKRCRAGKGVRNQIAGHGAASRGRCSILATPRVTEPPTARDVRRPGSRSGRRVLVAREGDGKGTGPDFATPDLATPLQRHHTTHPRSHHGAPGRRPSPSERRNRLPTPISGPSGRPLHPTVCLTGPRPSRGTAVSTNLKVDKRSIRWHLCQPPPP